MKEYKEKAKKNLRLSISLVFLIVLVEIGAGCTTNNAGPANLIPPPKMVQLLIDLHLAEAEIIERRYREQDSAYWDYYQMEKKIFRRYQVDSLQYARSYAFYAKKAEQLKQIYAAVVDSLSYRENIARNESTKPGAKKTSSSGSSFPATQTGDSIPKTIDSFSINPAEARRLPDSLRRLRKRRLQELRPQNKPR
ncbi:MAG: hypothetical protein OHK0053_25630 [Microscillaceae bacterium]